MLMNVRHILCLVFACFLASQWAVATENYKFRILSPDGGFYYDGVKAIEQDADGFIWIMMDYELYRFDGYHYKKYYPYFASIAPTEKWVFNNMASDSSGYLYVNTSNGLYRYNPVTDSFRKILDKTITVKTDKKNNIWVWNGDVWRILDAQDGTLKTPLFDGKEVTYTNPAFCMHYNDLYTFINHKVYRFNYAGNEFVQCFTMPHEDAPIRFARASMGKLWVFINKYGLYKIDLSTFRIEDHYENFPFGNKGNTLRAFYIDKKGYIWFGAMNGLYILDPVTRRLSHYEHSRTEPFSLPNNSIWTINEDRQRNVWLGTYTGIVCYVNIDESNAFTTYLPQNSKLNHTPVSAFAEDRQYLWIGTEGGGVNRMDKATGEFSFLTNENGLTSNNVKSLVTDAGHNVWLATFMGGLDCYDIGTKGIANYKRVKEERNSLLVNDVRKTIQEADSGLWVAYQHHKPVVSYFSFKEKAFTHYSLDSTATGEYIFDILRQGEKYLWGISNETLYRMDITTHAVEKFMPGDSTYMGLYTFCLDASGGIWIGTIGNGLIKFDTNTSRYIYLKELLQHNIYSIYSICYDSGNIWMGTDNGLYCYNIVRNELMNFDKREGTQGQVYYPLASMKGEDGKIYFGGTNGFTVIDTKKISRNEYKPKALISDFFIDHKPSHPDYTFSDSVPQIVLGYDEINFGFQFSSDNYHIPEKNLFRYRLKGYDDRWITTNAASRTAMYSKVPAGTYYFEVLAANNDGVWGDIPTIIKIVRKPAPWFSWPAYILYGLITLGILYMIYRYYSEKKRLKMQLYIESIEKDKKEQIHQAQLRFFTNISHDFRTPLSLIIAALDKLRREGLKEYYYRILNGNAQRLLNLVNELMDFRTIENGKMKLELEPLDMNGFVKGIAADFTDYAAQRHITFRVKCDAALPVPVFADKSIVEKIVMNLLNNAFKYTPDHGTVTLETKSGDEQFVSRYQSSYTVGEGADASRMFFIIVSDTGVGVSGESIGSVFERFYKVNTVNADSHLGTGIGLALVKSLVLLHKGSIAIYSERNEGTDMVVRFPLDNTVFDETDFLKQEGGEPEDMQQTQESADLKSAGNIENLKSAGALEEEKDLLPSNKKRILIAEDNEDLRVLIAEFLSDEFQVVQAADGLEALKLITESEFDLVISDIMMPHKDGVSLCNDVKGNINTSHIPFVLLTAKTSLESKLEGVDSGADLYFEKPVDLNYLKLSLQNVFKNQQQLKEYYAKNYYADSSELATNEQDSKFLKDFISFIEANLDQSEMDINRIAGELSMSRSKLYTKVKSLTGKSVVEFVLNYRLRKAAKLIIEENMTMKEVMMQIGIESQPYFTNSFKKMFGETPTAFAKKHKSPKEI